MTRLVSGAALTLSGIFLLLGLTSVLGPGLARLAVLPCLIADAGLVVAWATRQRMAASRAVLALVTCSALSILGLMLAARHV
jgi:hypothetical protein